MRINLIGTARVKYFVSKLTSRHTVPFVLLCGSLLWMSFATGNVTYFLDTLKFTPGFLLFTLACLFFFFTAARQKDETVLYDSLQLRLLGLHFLLTIFPAVFWSKGYDSLHLISINLGCFCLVFLMLNFVRRRGQMTALLGLVVAILFAVSVAGILEYFGLFLLKMNVKGQRIASFFLYPTVYSGFLVLLVPAAAVSFLVFKKPIWKVFAGVAAILGFVNLMLSQSRASIVAFAAAFVCFLVFYLRFFNKKKHNLLIIGISVTAMTAAFMVMLAVSPVLRQKISDMFVTLNPRWVIYEMAVRMWTRSPLTVIFGNGIGSFKYLSFTYKPPGYRALTPDLTWDAVHNEYLELLVDGGIVSLAAFLVLCVFVLATAWRIMKNDRIDSSRRYAALAGSLSLIAFLVDIIFSTNSRVSFNLFFFYFFMSLTAAAANMGEESHGTKPRLGRKTGKPQGKTLALLFMIAVLIPGNFGFWARFLSETRLAGAFRYKGGSDESISLLEKARRTDPRNIYPLYSLAENYLSVGRFGDFYGTVESVERKIPNFRSIEFMRGAALTAEGLYLGAAGTLETYLRLDRYDFRAKTHLLFVYSVMSDWDNAVKTLIRIVKDEISFGKVEEADLIFPEGFHTVRRLEKDDGFILEFGTGSMETVMKEILATTDPVLYSYFFRFHYVMGNIYSVFELPELAVKHYIAGYDNFNLAIELLGPPETRDETAIDAGKETDAEKFQKTLSGLHVQLNRMIERAALAGDSLEEIRCLRQYLDVFPEDLGKKERLTALYRERRNFKALKRLDFGL